MHPLLLVVFDSKAYDVVQFGLGSMVSENTSLYQLSTCALCNVYIDNGLCVRICSIQCEVNAFAAVFE